MARKCEELENILGRAIIFMNYNETYIDVHHLPPLHNEEQVESKQSHLLPELEEKPLEHLVTEFEGNIIYEYLERFDGNKTQTAKALGISVRNLYYKLEKYDHAKIACNKLRTVQFIAWYTNKNKTESFVIFQSIDFTAF